MGQVALAEAGSASRSRGLVLVGVLLLAGYAAHLLGAHVCMSPRVTLLILLGVRCGPHLLKVVPTALSILFPYIAHFALAMVGFLLGEAVRRQGTAKDGPFAAVATTDLRRFFDRRLRWCDRSRMGVMPALLLAGIAPRPRRLSTSFKRTTPMDRIWAGRPRWCGPHIGWRLLPQAGDALRLAQLAAEKIPEVGQRLLPMVIATTVFFEFVGPIATHHLLKLAGETPG